MHLQKQRDISIDILKCLAAILITNSHMELLYGKFSVLATGGAIGDALFFFCSGFTIFYGRNLDFFNWYKRRINRIYPTVFAWALVTASFFGKHNDLPTLLLSGGGWFVSCIMLYYIVLWFIKRYTSDKLYWAYGGVIVAILLWYYFIGIDDKNGNNMYGACYFKWIHYFIFMLLGATMGLKKKNGESFKKYGILATLLGLGVCIMAFYALCWFKNKDGFFDALQIASLFPLIGVCYLFYQLCNNYLLMKAYENKVLGPCIRVIGGLCLEIYLVQSSLFTDKMNFMFPLNLPIMFLIILGVAYLVHSLSHLWSQTFREENYDIKKIFTI